MRNIGLKIRNFIRSRKSNMDENRPVRSIELAPNMWQIVYADEPLPRSEN